LRSEPQHGLALVGPTGLGGSRGKPKIIDMFKTGTDPKTGQKTRVLAAMVPQGQQTWFYKLMGPDQAVESNKDAFLAFVQTARYH